MKKYRIYSKRLAQFLLDNKDNMLEQHVDLENPSKMIYIFEETNALHVHLQKYEEIKAEYLRSLKEKQ